MTESVDGVAPSPTPDAPGGWQLLRGAFAAGPALVAHGSGLLELVVQGIDLQLYHATQKASASGAPAGFAFGALEPIGGRTRAYAC